MRLSILCLTLSATASICSAGGPTSTPRDTISATPLAFVPGNVDGAFACQGLDYGLFIESPAATLVLRGRPGSSADAGIRFVPLETLLGVVAVPEQELEAVTNVYRGQDPASWRVDVPNYERVRCAQVYAGIDLVYYGKQGELEYDFVLAPHADPCAIAFTLEGGHSVRLDEHGDLIVATSAGDLVQRAPVAYQVVDGRHVVVDAAYELEATTVRFCVGKYDATLPLVIDPVVIFSTFLGGSGADQAWDFDVDSAGNYWIAGYTASTNFPRTTPGALNGFWDMFVAKFDPTGAHLLFSTLLSATGSGTSITEFATGIACDLSGNAVVTGRTNAIDFPMLNARQPLNAGNTDAVVVKLDPLGQLIFSTYHGGSGNENGRYDSISRCGRVAVDETGSIYVAGSSNSIDFPLANALDPIVSGPNCVGGCSDMFLTKFTPDGQTLVFSTFIGDALPEEPVGIEVDANHDIYLGGNNDAILLHKISADGQTLLWSRAINHGPGGGHSQLIAFDVDSSGQIVLTGLTSSGAFPTTPGTWRPTYTGCFSGTCEEAFVTILAPNNGPILASTYVGEPTYNEAGTAIRFDHNGDVVFALRSRRDSGAWFGEVWKFDASLSQRLALVLMCGSGEATDVLVDSVNNVTVVGWVWNGSSPAPTPGAFQTTHGGNIDVFLSKFDMQSPPPSTPFLTVCAGDGSGSACPCGNASAAGSGTGCLNSLGLGARLASTGIASLSGDTLVLHGSGMPNSSALYFQGTTSLASGAGAAFGDGLRCAGGSIARLSPKNNANGQSSYPGAGELSISSRAAITSTGPRVYQVWYRNAVAFCTPSTFNLTNGGEIVWQP